MYNNIRMKFYGMEKEIPLNWVTMPDGLPHFHIERMDVLSNCIDNGILIRAKIKTGDDLIRLQMLNSVLQEFTSVRRELIIEYMSAERMDRAITMYAPQTLKLWCQAINQMKFDEVEVYCPHSEIVLAYLDRSPPDNSVVEKYFYTSAFTKFNTRYFGTLADYSTNKFSVVIPDMGAYKRFEKLGMIEQDSTVICHKLREQSTGKLKGFSILAGMPRQHCLILDDLCDGGGTFAGQAEVLKKNGAKVVGLACFHGIFSKNLPISNIDWVSCTNSFHEEKILSALGVNHVYCN